MTRYLAICVLISPLLTGSVSGQADSDAASIKPSPLSAAELKIWNDPSFQRQFAQSYMAETEIEPRVTSDERERMMKILELVSSDQIDKAEAQLQRHRGEAASAVFDFTLANIFFQREAYDQAADAYKVAVDKFPKFRRAWKNLGLIYIRAGDYENALPALTRVVELGGGDALTYGLLGYAYSNVENNLPAESAYRMAILLDPETMDWKMGLARSLFKQERYAEAASLCDSLLTDHPSRADLWLLQANAYIGLGQPRRAAENYELVDQFGHSSVESLQMLGDIYVNEELFDLAVNAYLRAMATEPGAPPNRIVRAARVMAARGAHDAAELLIEEIEHTYSDQLNESDRKDLLKLSARLAAIDGATDEEARILEEIVQLDPLDGEALILLGQYHGRKGDVEKAVFNYERAASLEDHEADAKIRHAQLLVRHGKYAEAIPLLRSAQQIKPRDNVQDYLEQVERIAKAR